MDVNLTARTVGDQAQDIVDGRAAAEDANAPSQPAGSQPAELAQIKPSVTAVAAAGITGGAAGASTMATGNPCSSAAGL